MPVMRYIVALVLALPFPALAGITGVASVIDGDTIEVNAHPWPGMTVRVLVRLNTIDAPEIAGKCPEEKALAIRARDRLKALAGSTVQLVDVRRGRCTEFSAPHQRAWPGLGLRRKRKRPPRRTAPVSYWGVCLCCTTSFRWRDPRSVVVNPATCEKGRIVPVGVFSDRYAGP